MIPAVAQTLAEILAGGTALISTEQIDFNHPGVRQDIRPSLNLFCYNIQQNERVQMGQGQIEDRNSQCNSHLATAHRPTVWFDVSFLVSAWDRTALGEQRLLSEALTLLLSYQILPEELLAPALRGYGNLSITVSAFGTIDAAILWNALAVPLRPALYVTVTIPFNTRSAPNTPCDRIVAKPNQASYVGNSSYTSGAIVAGIVKSAATTQPLAATEVEIVGTKKVTTSNQEGLFFFYSLPLGDYLLELRCPGYTSQRCKVIVALESDTFRYAFKEIELTPEQLGAIGELAS